jgi:hypothetical protein
MHRRSSSALAFLLAVMAATPAWAHAHLVSSVPAVGGETAPTATLRLNFSEGIEIRFSKVEIAGNDGKTVGPAAISLDPADDKVVVVSVPETLAAGTYKVHWQVVSVDTHRTQGDFTFLVK